MKETKFKAYVHSENKIFPVSAIYTNYEGANKIEIIGKIKPIWAVNAGRKEYVPTSWVQKNNFTLLFPTGKRDASGDMIYDGDLLQKGEGYAIYSVGWNDELLQWQAGGMALGLLEDYNIVGNKLEGGENGR